MSATSGLLSRVMNEALSHLALCRPGGDLLSRAFRHSTIGAGAFNGRVRDGIGFGHLAIATRPAKRKLRRDTQDNEEVNSNSHRRFFKLTGWALINENDQADRAISTGKLHALQRFHTQPIDVVLYHGSQGRSRFQVGFPLRCLQRLSRPHIATLHCRWRDNRSTSGASTPVLSY